MKVKEAINMLNSAELLEFRAALEAKALGNQTGVSEWFAQCVALSEKNPNWGEEDLVRAMKMNSNKSLEQNISYLRTRTSAIVNSIDKFLTLKAFEKNQILQDVCLLYELNRRGCKSDYLQTYKKALKRLNQMPLLTFEHHAASFALSEDYLLSHLTVGHHDYARPLFQQSLLALDRAYALKKMSLGAKALSQDRDRKTHHEIELVGEILEWVSSLDMEQEPLLHLYALLYRMIKDEKADPEQTYFKAKGHLRRHWQLLKEDRLSELQDVFSYLINYCITRANLGEKDFQTELVELYDWLLPAGILEIDGKIQAGNFRNAYLALAISNDQAALERLVNDYGGRVLGVTARATVLLCRGYNAFRCKNYDAAEDAFAAVMVHLPLHADDRLEAEAYAMRGRGAYLQGNYHEARDQAKALERLLARHRLDEAVAKPFKLFTTFFHLLIKAALASEAKHEALCHALSQRLASSSEKVFAEHWLQMELVTLMEKGHQPSN